MGTRRSTVIMSEDAHAEFGDNDINIRRIVNKFILNGYDIRFVAEISFLQVNSSQWK
jgi:hypothetical protein